MKIRQSLRFHRKLGTELVGETIGSAIRNRTDKAVSVRDLCRIVGVNDVTAMPMPVEGFLVNTPSGLAIRVNSDRSVTRQRFTIAHELGHILLSRHEGKPIEVKCRSQDFSSDEESLVDMIAAEILMPSDEISKLVRACPAPWDAIEHIVWGYRVSYTAAIRRVLNLDGLFGVWISGNETHCDTLSAWSTDSVRAILDTSGIWKRFCWNPSDGTCDGINILVEDSLGNVRRERLKATLRYMYKMGSRSNSKNSPKNCWILAWADVQRPMVQLLLDFGFEL